MAKPWIPALAAACMLEGKAQRRGWRLGGKHDRVAQSMVPSDAGKDEIDFDTNKHVEHRRLCRVPRPRSRAQYP
jgi:hypothetical protein